ncbi:MAG: HNH endonuclease signature motif containing protein [Pseudoruegeria sp.]
MNGKTIIYSAKELAWLKANQKLPRKVAHAKFIIEFERKDVSFDNIKSLYTRNGWASGRTGRFEKGHEPHNLGKKMPFNANSAATRFQPGTPPHNTKFIGHERVTKDGYLEISVADINPHTGADRRYVQKHRHLWEKLNGPVPDGMCLKCLDGDKTNTAPENWACIPRNLLPRLNNRWGRKYDSAEPEVKPTLMTIAKLEHAVSVKQKR